MGLLGTRFGLGGRLVAALVLLGLVSFALACSNPPATTPTRPAATASQPDPVVDTDFDADRAWKHARRIAAQGPGDPGSRGAEKSRAYVRKWLEKTGVRVDALSSAAPGDADAAGFVTLVGQLDGASSDVFLLATNLGRVRAPHAEETEAMRLEAASGPAVLLELARVLADAPRPYTIWLVFVEGDVAEPGAETDIADPFAGSRALVEHLAEQGDLERIRMALWLDSPGRPDLLVARDLRSHRSYREVFWQSAESLGRGDVFADENEFDRAETGHLIFVDHGMRRVVAIAPRGDPGAVSDAGTESDEEALARDRMAAVGAVTLESLDRIAQRLERIDGFAESPLGQLPGETDASANGPAGPDGSEPSPPGGRGGGEPLAPGQGSGATSPPAAGLGGDAGY